MSLEVAASGRLLNVLRDGAPVATLRLGIPGEPEPDADPDVAAVARVGDVTVRVRLFHDTDAVSLITTLDHSGAADAEVPAVGLALEPEPGWSAWAWSADTDGLALLTRDDGSPGGVACTLRQGFWRAEPQRPVFAAEPADAVLSPGSGAFHLVAPGTTLAAGRRLTTVLRVAEVADADAAAGLLPGWLPDLVAPEGAEVLLRTPDVGVLPGPGVDAVTVADALALTGPPGHREVALHGVRGVTRLRVTWAPHLAPWLAEYAHVMRSRRPSAVSTATGAVVAEALHRRTVLDPDAALDWLEREDWLARCDLLGVAAASALAVETADAALIDDAWRALRAAPTASGFGLVALRLWLATVTVTGAAADLAGELRRRPGPDAETELVLGLLGHGDAAQVRPRLAGIVRRLGGTLPGQPLGLSAADAARLVGLLRLCPEGWDIAPLAAETAEKTTRLLLADYADGLHRNLDGLAWLLVGGLGI